MADENGKNFVRIAILENTFEADLLVSALKDLGIGHQIRSFHDTAYDGLFQVQKGWGEICAPASFRREILELINDIRSKNT